MRNLNLSRRAARRVSAGLGLLQRWAPGHYRHVVRVLHAVAYIQDGCDGGIACTGGEYPGVAVFATNPAFEDIVELAVLLSHEARHYRFGRRTGRLRYVDHNCGECETAFEQMLDPMYQADERLRRHLRARLAARYSSFAGVDPLQAISTHLW